MGNRISYCEEAPAPAQAEAEPVEETPAAEVEEPEAQEEQPAEEEKPVIKIGTAPMDFRFPSINQSRTCYTHYNEYHKCLAAHGEGNKECLYHYRFFRAMCPNEWVEKWDELREEGNWFGKY